MMRWHITKRCGTWWAIGWFVRPFDTWLEAIDWVDTQHVWEPTG